MRYGQATQTQLERAPRTPSHGWLNSSKAERQGRAESEARQDESYHQSGSKIIGPTSPFSPPSLPPPLRRVPVSCCFRPALGFLGPAPPGPGPCSLPPPPLIFCPKFSDLGLSTCAHQVNEGGKRRQRSGRLAARLIIVFCCHPPLNSFLEADVANSHFRPGIVCSVIFSVCSIVYRHKLTHRPS